MITISLDEYGNFERNDGKPLFIAGLIFDDMETDDSKAGSEAYYERKRIAAYYKKVISDVDASFAYPEALHCNDDKSRDSSVVKPVKQKVSDTFAEFIQKGTYNGQPLLKEDGGRFAPRTGRYHLFVMLKSDEGKKQLLSKNASMFVNDDWAANRYFHMAGEVVNRIIFHNPFYPGEKLLHVNVDIATRASGNLGEMNADKKKEFELQGFRAQEGTKSTQPGDERQYFSIMNADIYRTLIAQEMLRSDRSKVKIEDFHVSSISYSGNGFGKEFLYLADSICSILQYALTGNTADGWLTQIVGCAQKITGHPDNLIFGYDQIDNAFSQAWSSYENKHFFDSLSEMYDAKKQDSVFARHYKTYWFPFLEERIIDALTPDHLRRSMDDLKNLTLTNNLDQGKLVYIMQVLEKAALKIEKEFRTPDSKGRTFYKLYDAGVSAFCHIGDTANALIYYEKSKEYAFYAGIDDYLSTSNKLVVCLEDYFEWDKAEEIASENIAYQELLSEIRRELLKQGTEADYLDEAKAISQKARVLAEKRMPETESLFRLALSKLEQGSANYKITQSFLLHFYADMGMKEAFEQELHSYFDGKTTPNQQLKFLLDIWNQTDSVYDTKYALYVLIRGIWLKNDVIDQALWDKLCSLPEKISEKNNGILPGGHPWEIIYKYLRLMAIKQKEPELEKHFEELQRNCLRYRGDTIDALELFGEAEVALYRGDMMERDRYTAELVTCLNEKFPKMKEMEFSEDGDVRFDELSHYFTYMYR